MLIYALCRIYAFFSREIHQSAKFGGSSQSWQCQDFHGFCYSHPSLNLTHFTSSQRLSESPDLIAMGQWAGKIPGKPDLPDDTHIGQVTNHTD